MVNLARRGYIHVIGHAVGQDQDGRHPGAVPALFDDLDAVEDAVPQVGGVAALQALDVLAGGVLVLLGHGREGLDDGGLAGEGDDAEAVVFVHGLDDGEGGVLDEVEHGEAGALGGVLAGDVGAGAHAARDVDDEDDVRGDVVRVVRRGLWGRDFYDEALPGRRGVDLQRGIWGVGIGRGRSLAVLFGGGVLCLLGAAEGDSLRESVSCVKAWVMCRGSEDTIVTVVFFFFFGMLLDEDALQVGWARGLD